MINNILETIGTTFIIIFMLSGAGFILWWGIESAKRFCINEEC